MSQVHQHDPAARPPLTDDLYDAQRGACFHCLSLMDPWPWSKRHANGFTREHVSPKSGGYGAANNTVLAHQRCNQTRGTKHLSKVDMTRARLLIAAVVAKRGGWK